MGGVGGRGRGKGKIFCNLMERFQFRIALEQGGSYVLFAIRGSEVHYFI